MKIIEVSEVQLKELREKHPGLKDVKDSILISYAIAKCLNQWKSLEE